MDPIIYIDRKSGKKEQELVYGAAFLNLVYGNCFFSRFFGQPLSFILARLPLFSYVYGAMQRTHFSKRKVLSFIEKFKVDTSEFVKAPGEFTSFNDFFIRHLKKGKRLITSGNKTAIIPADGRYLFYQNIKEADGFIVKSKKFSLKDLLQNEELAKKYAEGSMVIARLCPTDYHRFHFPVDCIPGKTDLINGPLYSVNPAAVKKNINIFSENKRTLCILNSDIFGKILFLEIGAVCVGTIHETYTHGNPYHKGDEKGFFSFGGSSLIMIFPPNTICFDQDLIEASKTHTEIRCLMGQSMGQLISP